MDWLEDFQATPQRTSFSWDLNSNLDATDLPNGADVDDTYDANDRVTGIDHTNSGGTIASFDYTRDQLAQVDSISTALADDGDYTYDDLNRLEGLTSASWDFSFDDADNLARLLDGRTLHYNAGNELVEQRYIGTTTETYGYDLRGNRTSRTVTGTSTTTSYTFDQANRLEGVGGLANYRYDGDGLRTRSTIWTVPTSFVWDQASGSLPMLLSASNAAGDTHYIYGPDGLAVEQITDDGTSLTPVWFGHDQLGSTRILTDTTATKVAQYDYSPYGALTGYTGTASTRLQYAGQYTDAETGFQYLRARHYDPTTRQFLTRDPITPLTRSPYGYVVGDPLNGTDPSGLWLKGRCLSGEISADLLVGGVGGRNDSTCVGSDDYGDFTIRTDAEVSGFNLSMSTQASGFVSNADAGWELNAATSCTEASIGKYIFAVSGVYCSGDGVWVLYVGGGVGLGLPSLSNLDGVTDVDYGDGGVCSLSDYEDRVAAERLAERRRRNSAPPAPAGSDCKPGGFCGPSSPS